MDFYLGIVMATIFEKYPVYVVMEGGFTKEQIISPHAVKYIFQLIPTLKDKLKIKLDCRLSNKYIIKKYKSYC